MKRTSSQSSEGKHIKSAFINSEYLTSINLFRSNQQTIYRIQINLQPRYHHFFNTPSPQNCTIAYHGAFRWQRSLPSRHLQQTRPEHQNHARASSLLRRVLPKTHPQRHQYRQRRPHIFSRPHQLLTELLCTRSRGHSRASSPRCGVF